jgi:hypothetical protein
MKVLVDVLDSKYLVDANKNNHDIPYDIDDLVSKINEGRYPDECYNFNDIQKMEDIEVIAFFNDNAEMIGE